jgi:hypothetical protein
MNKQTALQYAQKEAEFLRKRAWDFIYSLEKLEKDLKKSVDADERRSLKIRIQNTRRLLEDYKSEYKTICKEAGIPSEIIGTGIIKNDQSIDLPPLFLVPARDPNFLGRRDKVREFIQRVCCKAELLRYAGSRAWEDSARLKLPKRFVIFFMKLGRNSLCRNI